MKQLFGTFGVRRVANTVLTPEFASKIAAAYGTKVKGTIAIGSDPRTSSEMIKHAVTAGLLSAGCNVVDLGMLPTPAVQYAVRKYYDGGIMITASHNPPKYNGLKLLDADGIGTPDELEEEIAASGNYFLIRGKKSTAGRIICLSDTYGHVIQHKYAGMAVKEVELPEFDAEVRFGKDHTIRIVKCQIRDPKSGGMVISYFRTNVPRENLGLKQCGYLYRLRWSIELMNKVCKSYNGMSTVNSSKPHIIIEFLLLSLLSTLFKTIMAHLTQTKFKLEYISMLKVHELSVQFERLLTSLILGSKRRISQIVKELLAYMAEHCLRSKPSRTNRKLVKDFPRQVEKILRLKNPWQIKMA